MARNVPGLHSQSAGKKVFSLVFSITSKTPWSVAEFPSVTVESRRELRTGSAPDGKLLAGNHRQFRCYCPLEPLRKVCILTALLVAEFRRAAGWRHALACRFSVILGKTSPSRSVSGRAPK